MLRVLAICYALQHYTFCICALALYRASLRLGLRALSQYTSLSLKLFYLVKFFPVHLMSSGTDHSSRQALLLLGLDVSKYITMLETFATEQ